MGRQARPPPPPRSPLPGTAAQHRMGPPHRRPPSCLATRSGRHGSAATGAFKPEGGLPEPDHDLLSRRPRRGAASVRSCTGMRQLPQRDGHLPVHRRRGVDAAARGAWRAVRGAAGGAPSRLPGGVRAPRRRRGRHAGRRVLCRVSASLGRARGGGGGPAGLGRRRHDGADGRTHGRADPVCRGVRRDGRPPRSGSRPRVTAARC
jgi:hypothetical protein